MRKILFILLFLFAFNAFSQTVKFTGVADVYDEGSDAPRPIGQVVGVLASAHTADGVPGLVAGIYKDSELNNLIDAHVFKAHCIPVKKDAKDYGSYMLGERYEICDGMNEIVSLYKYYEGGEPVAIMFSLWNDPKSIRFMMSIPYDQGIYTQMLAMYLNFIELKKQAK